MSTDRQAEVTHLTAERDALAAQVARVEELAAHWEYLMGESSDGKMLSWGTAAAISALALRKTLAGPEVDTNDTQPTDSGAVHESTIAPKEGHLK